MTTDDPLANIEECKQGLLHAKGEEKARLYETMGDAYLSMDKGSKAQICFTYAYDGGLRDNGFIAKYARSLCSTGKIKEAEALIQDTLKGSPTKTEKARSYTVLSYIASERPDFIETKRHANVASRILEGTDPSDPEAMEVLAQANNMIGLSLWRQAQLEKAIPYYERALEIFEGLGDVQGVSKVQNNIGNVYYHLGRFDKAKEYYERSNEAKERVSYYNNMGLIYMIHGEFDKAEEMYKTCIKRIFGIGYIKILPVVQLNLADLCFEKGDLVKARSWVESANQSIKQLEYSPKMSDAYQGLAKLELFEGDLKSAEAHIRKAMDLAQRSKRRTLEAAAIKILGMIEHAKGDTVGAKKKFRTSIDTMKKHGMSFEAGFALVEFTKVLKELGEQEEAARTAAEAKEILTRLGIRYELDKLKALGY
jgi:tetratricopeptide (TPR) repeat protein